MVPMVEKMKQVVKKLHEKKVPVCIGTDAPFFATPGLGVHQEMKNFVDCGLTPEEAWAAGTNIPGRLLKTPFLGTLQAKAPADFLIFRRDPVKDLANLDTLEAVVADGRFYSISLLKSNFEHMDKYYKNPIISTFWKLILKQMIKTMQSD